LALFSGRSACMGGSSRSLIGGKSGIADTLPQL
jgi:hypothetical protein